jgi:hypothetical protein
LIRDGLGLFFQSEHLKEKIRLKMVREGLTEKCNPEAYGELMDLTEDYFR